MLEGEVVEVFIPNPGRMHELMIPNRTVYLRLNPASHRRTDYDMIAVLHHGLRVSVDSNLPNRFMKEMLKKRRFSFFGEYEDVRSEPAVYDGRFDFELSGRDGTSLIEVKSCTLVENGIAYFPDAVTERGARHMQNLAKALEEGLCSRAYVVFVIQRPDAKEFRPQDERDPVFGESLRDAERKGVQILPLLTELEDWSLRFIRLLQYKF
jgi:sugar fermentation stimulation protein A